MLVRTSWSVNSPWIRARIRSQPRMSRRANRAPRWSNVTRHPVLPTFIMLHREEVRRPLQRPVQLPLTSEVQRWKPYWLFYWCCFCSEAGAGVTVVTAASTKGQHVCKSAARTNKMGAGNAPTILIMNGFTTSDRSRLPSARS
jgi:hypothetical protein